MAKTQIALDLYKTRLNNLEWHYDVNGKYETKEELEALKTRINDYREFVEILTALTLSR